RSAQRIFSFSKDLIDNKTLENIPSEINNPLALLMLTLEKKEKTQHQIIDFLNQQGEPVFIEINTSLVMKDDERMSPYTDERRDVSENTPPEARGKSRGPRGVYFPIHPDSRQCTDILSSLSGKY
ncbi:MAG: hypothetical protein GY705_09465, partial [Bacteroidetes bacterium]|nr:hypothetical protein [Bacteroidota bacterium]